MENKTNRRKLFKMGFLTLASLPFLKISKAFAEACKITEPTDPQVLNRMVKEDDPAAKRLDYVAQASDSKHELFKEGQDCSNCRFYRVQMEKENWAPCTMLANRFVPTCAWCRSYQPNPS